MTGNESALLAAALVGSLEPASSGATGNTVDNSVLMAEGDPRLRQWLDRCLEWARSELDGIEEPASDLASLAEGDRSLMERARRVLLEALARKPGHSVLVQMYALWRRSFEKGSWSWEP